MPSDPFDDLVRTLGQPRSRRALIALLTTLLLPFRASRPAQARLCTRNGRPCRADRQCCSGHCAGRTVCRNPDRRRNKRNKPNRKNRKHERCRGPEKRCRGRCVNVRTSRRHCGSCGHRCASFERCRGGRCVCDGCGCDVCPRGCPFTDVQDAVDAASSGDEIRICPGTYRGSVIITQALTLVGAGAARTRLTAGLDTIILRVDAAEVVVRGLTVAGARNASGIVNFGGPLTLAGCTVADNQAVVGGGIDNRSTLTLADSVVRDNVAELGAGILTDGTLMVTAGTTITENTATDHGGGIDNGAGGEVTVQDGAVITGNRAPEGGGIYTHINATTTLEPGATVADNEPDDCFTQPGGTLDGDCPFPP